VNYHAQKRNFYLLTGVLPINKVEKSKFCKGYDYDIPSIAGGYLIE